MWVSYRERLDSPHHQVLLRYVFSMTCAGFELRWVSIAGDRDPHLHIICHRLFFKLSLCLKIQHRITCISLNVWLSSGLQSQQEHFSLISLCFSCVNSFWQSTICLILLPLQFKIHKIQYLNHDLHSTVREFLYDWLNPYQGFHL